MISDLRHRVSLCSQKDVVVAGAELRLVREDVFTTWAAIKPKKGSTFSAQGAAMLDNRNVRTHRICIRYRPDIMVSAYAWIYEARRLSPPRWFKVLMVDQTEGPGSPLYEFDCRLVERGDELAVPGEGTIVSSLPLGVKL